MKVYLVGAGPGDPKLITVRGVECIREADVILYDRLANPQLLDYAKEGAELLYVGKLPDRHSLPQEEINALLVAQALQGKVVTRLKGGDPFVFGRGGEEALALRKHGIPYEVVPGITAGIAAPAYAGIPVTQRHIASSFAIVTGHECPGKEQSSIRWDKIATAVDTLAFYLGVKNLPLICEQLIAHGRAADTPVAIIHWGTTAEQVTVQGTLATITAIAREHNVQNPSIILVGEVVNLREQLHWFDSERGNLTWNGSAR
ncbi:uroporphyrinogen-III C-methyltransferase [Tumebacillus avium]|uniref:Uroporphyrinogen-III C-methyltransferase n=1 Tax=Tumebacillus avium TaxID=1903704 RepID=A0A1Y0IQ83_9BACL|nr:uroporphyrinogen-III C-methyltransferase [Tumebacillus avium]ARU61504.1 uroporphyrinogen-III C-methyltransferase [Tumebacillus avium]